MAQNAASSQVPYAEVAGLPFTPPESVIYGAGEFQYADYWGGPASDDLLILIHGGCWLNQFDLKHVRPLASELASRGISVLSPEYRRIGDNGGGWPGTFDDIQAAIKFAATPEKRNIYIAGHSAGGHLALWAAANNQHIKGVIGLAAISDLLTYATGTSGCERATIQLMDGSPSEQTERYHLASPLLLSYSTHVRLIHGESDPIVNHSQSVEFCSQHNCELTTLTNRGHFDVIDPRGQLPDLLIEQFSRWSMSHGQKK